jgi:L-aspartate oxidase
MPEAPNAAPVRQILSRYAGVLRDADGLAAAVDALAPLAMSAGAAADPALLGLMMVTAMQRRTESRGGHARTDFPAKNSAQALRLTLTWDQARAATLPSRATARPAAMPVQA